MSVDVFDEDVRHQRLREERRNVFDLLAKVQGDLKKLREELQARIDNEEYIDPQSLKTTLAQIEDDITNHAEVIVRLRHSRFETLPIAAPRKQPYNEQAKFLSTPYSSLMSSPGQNIQLQYISKLLSQPTHPCTRQILNDAFGIPCTLKLPPTQYKPLHTTCKQKLASGTTIKQLTSLPLINKRNPTLTPPPISSRDAQHGLLSLLERGLIPKAAEIILSPPPVQHRSAALHTFSKRDLKALPSDNAEGGGSLVGVKLDLVNYGKPVLPAIQANEQLTLSVKTLQVPLAEHQKEQKSDNEVFVDYVKDDEELSLNAQEFRISIRSGTVMDDYPSYIDFKAENEERWHSIQRILDCIERMAQDYAIYVIYVDTAKLLEVAEDYILEPLPKYKELLYCIVNSKEVEYFLYLPGRRYKGHRGIHAAAAKIQATFRMYLVRCDYLRHKRMKWAASVIEIGWILYTKAMNIKKQLNERRGTNVMRYRKRLQELNLATFNQHKRVIVHLPSKGYLSHIRNDLQKFAFFQNCQLPRICDVSDPNVEVIYVCPMELGTDIKDYYHQLLNTKESNNEDVWDRVHFIVPEHLHSFGGHNLSLSSLLKHSPMAIKQIKNIIGNRPSVLIPHIPMSDDMEIADTLGVPLLGSEPNLIYLYSTFQGRQALFEDAQVSTPPSITGIHSFEQLVEGLAWLVINNLSIKRWLFKIDHHILGRGFGYCDVIEHLNCYKWVVKERERYGEKWSKQWAQEQARQKILYELPSIVAAHSFPCNTEIFPSWSNYLRQLLSTGGSIQAHPPSNSITALTTDILLKPDNSYTLLSTWDHIHSKPYQIWGGTMPQCSVDPDELNTLVDKISKAALLRGLIGHVSIDYVTFINADMSQVVWAVDIDFGPTDVVYMNNLISMVSELPPTWPIGTPLTDPQHYAVVSTQLNHSNLALVEYAVFFQMCKAHLIGYNNKTSTGTIFTLIESQQRKNLGMICLQQSLSKALSGASYALSTIHQEICTSQMQGRSNFPSVSKVMSNIAKQLEINSSKEVTES